ncbi:hypothetical protein IAQ61_001919 [Plenodomus lingam]|uniref:uncharacterized protein n=1 Tax=Leptosphaeria maculans TaxID=5022 RepID=UPI003321609A|nr:hypothetical protein IAQ61_001919 [Plenodomus lingam]
MSSCLARPGRRDTGTVHSLNFPCSILPAMQCSAASRSHMKSERLHFQYRIYCTHIHPNMNRSMHTVTVDKQGAAWSRYRKSWRHGAGLGIPVHSEAGRWTCHIQRIGSRIVSSRLTLS